MTRKLIKLNLARNCLRYIIKAYKIKEIFVPYYICPTILSAIRSEKCNIKFYHINLNFYPNQEFPKEAYILYPNYFGICSKQIIELNSKYPNIIFDNAHNFYMPDCGLASFNSLRKFFNLKDGAFLKISKEIHTQFETDNFSYPYFKELSYDEFVSNELRLNNQGIKYISPTTEKYFSEINLEQEKLKRLKNFNDLHERFKTKNQLIFTLNKYDVPFIYPYLTYKNQEAEILQQEGYLILRYWNFLPEDFPEHVFYKYLIPIPC